MHGRLKVRTSEEEKERKKKEQALKVKAYRAAMSKIQTKRQLQEFDDEMLALTAQLLLRNPDISTLWNIRRQCVEQKAKKVLEEVQQEHVEPEAEQLDKLVEQLEETSKKLAEPTAAATYSPAQCVYDAELALTEQCLMVNPKSYGGWHQRCWTLEHSPDADWQREVQLCNKYLKLDERNFHTWDYRRYVVAKAGVPQQQELDFCTDKIKVNFSNYSSWHYRSLLLPVLHPYEGEALPRRAMSDEKLQAELEMVLTAAFTDPNDSSAWFYQRWLLGNSRPELDIAAFRCDGAKAVLALTKPIVLGDDFSLVISDVCDRRRLELTDWHSLSQSKSDTTWVAVWGGAKIFDFTSTDEYKIVAKNIPALALDTLLVRRDARSCFYLSPPNRRTVDFSPAVLGELHAQQESCDSLLEFEPDSKWTLLTSALLMRAIDPQQYHDKSLAYLTKLQQVDLLRAGYYKDLAAKWLMERLLTDWWQSADLPSKLHLDAATPQLSAIAYAQYVCIADEVVLSPELQKTYASGERRLRTFDTL